jgi:hypothetical protein
MIRWANGKVVSIETPATPTFCSPNFPSHNFAFKPENRYLFSYMGWQESGHQGFQADRKPETLVFKMKKEKICVRRNSIACSIDFVDSSRGPLLYYKSEQVKGTVIEMLTNAFTFRLEHPVLPGLVVVGKCKYLLYQVGAFCSSLAC